MSQVKLTSVWFFNLFRSSFQRNFDVVSKAVTARRPFGQFGARAVSEGRDVTQPTSRWLTGITQTGLRLAMDSKHVKNRQIDQLAVVDRRTSS